MTRNVVLELLLPFLGTSLGAGCVFFLKGRMNPMIQRSLTGFAAGVMVAASVWSLLVPAMEQAEDMGRWAFFPAVIGFWLGVLFLLVLDRTIPHLHQNSSQPEGPHTRLKRTTMLLYNKISCPERSTANGADLCKPSLRLAKRTGTWLQTMYPCAIGLVSIHRQIIRPMIEIFNLNPAKRHISILK